MTEDEYIAQRLDDQITWYAAKASACQQRYKALRVLEIIAAALIPFLSGTGDQVLYGSWLIGFLGVAIAISAAVSSLFKYHENWLQYRLTAEKLKQEKYLFATRCHPYHESDRFQLLVQRVEAAISSEASVWAKVTQQPTKTAESN